MNYELLSWDTEILGISTAKIISSTLMPAQLEAILDDLKKQKVKLVFWASDSQDEISQQAAHACNGFLADYKVTYLIDLTKLNRDNLTNTVARTKSPTFVSGDVSADTLRLVRATNMKVEVYDSALPNNQLEMLAIEIGARSRFGMDPKISREQMEKVYKTWIRNSTKKQIAKVVLVIKAENKIIGMVTIGDKNNRGDLSLVAIDPQYRGLNLGKRLVEAAQLWCIENGYQLSQVVTQTNNTAACKLYEKCGYQIEKVEHFYHFWL